MRFLDCGSRGHGFESHPRYQACQAPATGCESNGCGGFCVSARHMPYICRCNGQSGYQTVLLRTRQSHPESPSPCVAACAQTCDQPEWSDYPGGIPSARGEAMLGWGVGAGRSRAWLPRVSFRSCPPIPPRPPWTSEHLDGLSGGVQEVKKMLAGLVQPLRAKYASCW